jgi:hypothetical protein
MSADKSALVAGLIRIDESGSNALACLSLPCQLLVPVERVNLSFASLVFLVSRTVGATLLACRMIVAFALLLLVRLFVGIAHSASNLNSKSSRE